MSKYKYIYKKTFINDYPAIGIEFVNCNRSIIVKINLYFQHIKVYWEKIICIKSLTLRTVLIWMQL